MKSKYRVITLAAFAILSISLANPAHAFASPAFYLRTDKASYSPGDGGTLQITLRNQGDTAFTIKNYTISYPWMSYINDHWEGNVSVNGINQALASGGAAWNTQQSFTIPGDGRAYRFGTGTLRIGTDIGGGAGSYITSSFYVQMNAATYTPVEVSTSLFAIVTIAVLGLATFLLFTVSTALRRLRVPGTTH